MTIRNADSLQGVKIDDILPVICGWSWIRTFLSLQYAVAGEQLQR
jgi:hypothetical protein